MIYDKLITVCVPPAGFGAPFQGRLTVYARYLCGETTVYHRRYWESVQAGTRIDRMVRLPLHRDIQATMYAILPDGQLYRIEEAQLATDEAGLPVTNLSLRRMEQNYDLCRPEEPTAEAPA